MKLIKSLKAICAVLAVIGCAGLGYAIFMEPANKMTLIYVFGIMMFLGLQAIGLIALIGILKDKDTNR